jgi:hypothetical protein
MAVFLVTLAKTNAHRVKKQSVRENNQYCSLDSGIMASVTLPSRVYNRQCSWIRISSDTLLLGFLDPDPLNLLTDLDPGPAYSS